MHALMYLSIDVCMCMCFNLVSLLIYIFCGYGCVSLCMDVCVSVVAACIHACGSVHLYWYIY